ncbi:MAG: DUF1641 domain-containing protein [Desulfobacteraceae bacterium]|nr:DUF1641 domain-containing protein [Desulfobacteraceae bacterium]
MNTSDILAERIENIEENLSILTESANSINELKDDLAPRMTELVQALIIELSDIEEDFNIDDLIYLIKKVLRNIKNFDFVIEQTTNLIDFVVAAEPLLKITVPEVTQQLDELDQKGVFKLLSFLIDVSCKISEQINEEDYEKMSGSIVRLSVALKNLLTGPGVDLIERFIAMTENINTDKTTKVGMIGLLAAMSDKKVQEGLGVVLELTRNLSHLKKDK